MFLQRVSDDELACVVQLVNRAYRGDAGWTSEAGLVQGARLTEAGLRQDLLNRPDASLLLLRDDSSGDAPSEVLGTVWLEPKRQGIWYLGLLTVRPELQSTGVGRRLLAAAEEHARARGAARIRMTVVNVREQLIAWYERRGYLRTGEMEPFPYGDPRVGRPLRDDLSFFVLEKRLADAVNEDIR